MFAKIRWTGIIALAIVAIWAVCAVAETSGTWGENMSWVLDDNGTLTISGTGAYGR